MRLITIVIFFWAGILTAQPITQLPYSPSLDTTSMDPSVNACDNFYQYSCGNWNKKNPIPADQAAWNVYAKLAYDNQQFLWGLLEESAKPSPTRTAAQQKIGDYYHACMDEAAIDKAGISPIQPWLDQAAGLKSLADVAKFVVDQHRLGAAPSLLYGFSSNQDFEDSQTIIAFAGRGSLGLPDRDYYTKTDAKSLEIRAKYVDHMKQMFAMLGDDAPAAAAHANQVMAIETELAKSMLTRVELRNPHNLLHKMTPEQIAALASTVAWGELFDALDLNDVKTVNVVEPAFYRALEQQLHAREIDEWKSFLRWNIIRDSADDLSSPFAKAHFAFFSNYLRGVPEMKPRWRKCVERVDSDLGEALGQVFVAKTFMPGTKARTVAMTKEIELAMEKELKSLPWMGDKTREQALLKLHSIVNKIGYPAKWRDYNAVIIKPDDFFGDAERAGRFEYHRQLAKIGKPLDRGEWGMTPPTVNAY